ncbi:MAG: cysteine--tRNA ligase [Chloroflexota bacterium]
MALHVYNTLSRQKEIFETVEPNKVKMYVCGPTVYDKAHVGHAMSAMVFDIIRRYLEYRGYQVDHVMNYTDVDDKVILRAQQERVEPLALAEKYVREFQHHIEDLKLLPATKYPRATQEIDNIIKMVKGLEEKGFAYVVEGDVYFRVSRDEGYGKLSRRNLEDMHAGSRIGVDERKEHPMDFALWKSSKPGEPSWDSPWGLGRPGWHIECSAMSLNHLGDQIDIHGGGNDLIFPHHENEIAQTESLTGKPFARYWIHNGMLQLSGEKMSKSLGNLVTVEEFLSSHEADALRMMVLNASYRSPLTYNETVVEQAERALERLRLALKPAFEEAQGAPEGTVASLRDQVKQTYQGFVESMDDDFNTAGALGYLFDLVRIINQSRDAGATMETLKPAQEALCELAGVLGLELEVDREIGRQIAPFVNLLVDVRMELRQRKLWNLADKIRNRLADMGVILEDVREGTTWRWE